MLLSFSNFTTFVHKGNLTDVNMYEYKQQTHISNRKRVISSKQETYRAMGCQYICRDNHLLNCSIIFIIVAQYTQMNLKNRTALAEDNRQHGNSLNVVLKCNSELNYLEIDTENVSLSAWLKALPSDSCLPSRCLALARS
jgi:hypothetical protein